MFNLLNITEYIIGEILFLFIITSGYWSDLFLLWSSAFFTSLAFVNVLPCLNHESTIFLVLCYALNSICAISGLKVLRSNKHSSLTDCETKRTKSMLMRNIL